MRTVTMPNGELLPEIASLLADGHDVTLRVKGRSMLPFIVGDRDSVVLQKPGRLRKGDIVLAEISPGNFVLHRIVNIKGGYAILMGDGNLKETEQAGIRGISGRVATIIRNGEKIDATARKERIKAYFWYKLLPIRRYLLAIYKRTIYRYENQTRI